MKWDFWPLLFVIAIGMKLSVFTKKLTTAGAFAGGILGVCVYLGAGVAGVVMMAAFFILGTLATSWQKKSKAGFEEENNSQRKAGQVFANAGVAAMLSLLAAYFLQHSVLLLVMMASAFSSAMADTLSSELGNVYGKRFYNILSFKNDKRGRDGVISLEGTFAGICGSVVIGFIYVIGFQRNFILFLIIMVAGTIGNLSDSLLGAAFERKGVLQNDTVNFLNTFIAALAAWVLFIWF